MDWVIGSLVSLALFASTSILIKYNWRAGVPAPVINFATYAVAIFVFFFSVPKAELNVFARADFWLVLLAGLCVYFGNAASVRGLNLAPNPGYSQAINKSYVALTLIAAILFFGGELSWRKIAGIALILAGQLLITGKNPHAKKPHDSRWIRLSFAALFCYAGWSVAVKYAHAFLGVNQTAFLFWAVAVAMLFFAAEIYRGKISLIKYKKQFGSLFLIGLASGFANVFMWDAFVRAPNMGYVNAIQTAGVAIVSLLAVKLFGDEFTLKKSLGIAGVIFGLLLIVLP